MEGNKNVIVAVIAAVIIAGGAGAYFLLRDDASKTESTQQSAATNEQQQPATQDIVVIASSNSSLSTLVAAVKAAALVETLQGAGPYTVLAPTNDAFEKLPAGTLETLLKPENKDQLANILTYHVIQGQVLANQLTNGQKVKTVNGQELTVEVADGTVAFVDAKGGKAIVEKADVNASNGVVHVINAVLLPQ